MWGLLEQCGFIIRSTALVVLLVGNPAEAALRVLTNEVPIATFSGSSKIEVRIQNSGESSITTQVKGQIFQRAGEVAASLGQTETRKIDLATGQTVLESFQIELAEVKAPTDFIISWTSSEGTRLGITALKVYQKTLFKSLKPFIGDSAIGVYDPSNVLKPLLKSNALEIEDLERVELEQYEGKLIVLGPFGEQDQVPPRLRERLHKLAEKGRNSIYIIPTTSPIAPSYYILPSGGARIIVAQSETIRNLATDPYAQLRLLHMAELALNIRQPELPK